MIRITQTITVAPDTLDLPDLTVQVAFLDLIAERIKTKGMDVPLDLADMLKTSERELAFRLREDKEKKLKVLQTRREGLRTLDEKRLVLDKEIEILQQTLDK
jgi:predicted nucleic acid-binding protein